MIGKKIEYPVGNTLRTATILDKILIWYDMNQNDHYDDRIIIVQQDNYLVQWDSGEIDIIDPIRIKQVH